MAKIEKYSGVTADIATVLTSDLVSLANGSSAVGSAIDPTGLNATGAYWELLFTPTSSLTAGSGVCFSLYFVPTIDGTNYAAGSSSVVPAAVHLADQFIVLSGTGQQRLILPLVYFPPFKFKPVLLNSTGVAVSAATTHTLKYAPFRRFYVGT